jgi:hypothetical protein
MTDELYDPPHDVIITIRDNSTGVVRTGLMKEYQYYDSDWIWSDGNYSCDCNRTLFFARIGGDPEPTDEKCGHDRFDITVVDAVTGKTIYDELEEA